MVIDMGWKKTKKSCSIKTGGALSDAEAFVLESDLIKVEPIGNRLHFLFSWRSEMFELVLIGNKMVKIDGSLFSRFGSEISKAIFPYLICYKENFYLNYTVIN